jgi:hypothetical protein
MAKDQLRPAGSAAASSDSGSDECRRKREKLAGYEAPRGIGGEAFRAGRAGCEEDQNHHRQPCNHTEPFPVTFSDSNLLLVNGR